MKTIRITTLILALCGATGTYAQSIIDNDILNADLERLLKTVDSRGSFSDNSGLVAYYPFINGYKDESGNGNDGQAQGSASIANDTQSTEANTCLSLGGVDRPGCVKIRNSSSLTIKDGWTFAARVMLSSARSMDGWGRSVGSGGAQAILAKSHDRSGFIIFCSMKDGKFNTWMGGSNGWPGGISANMDGASPKQWIHLAYTYSNGQWRVYLNGKLKTTKDARPDFSRGNSQDLYLGKFSDSWYPLNGMLDEVRIYNRGLSAEEVAELAEM